MGSKRQRQDVAFLALAVAALTISVALLVGLRMLPRGGGKEAENGPEETAAAVEQTEIEAPAPEGRDPFGAEQGAGVTPSGGPAAGAELKLIGIVQGRQPLAVVRRESRRYYVRLGDSVRGYRVTAIGEDRVILAKGEERMTLVLREPREEDEDY